jgi:hypothetical protein
MSKDMRYNKLQRAEFVEDDRWVFKGGPMLKKTKNEPEICPDCEGLDPECPTCHGDGVIYD